MLESEQVIVLKCDEGTEKALSIYYMYVLIGKVAGKPAEKDMRRKTEYGCRKLLPFNDSEHPN